MAKSRCLIPRALMLSLFCAHEAGAAGAGAEDYASERAEMVGRQIADRGVSDERVLAAMRKVPRHEFVPESEQRMAYHDTPLPIGENQTISQPYIVALMTELARPEKDHRVLEVGTGSGYQAAVLAELVDKVYSIEIEPTLARTASDVLQRLGYDNVTVRAGDGYMGWQEHAPFDVIMITAAPDHVPAPLIAQLKPGGRMVVPVGPVAATQQLRVLAKNAAGDVTTTVVAPVRFVPLRRRDDQ
ncbi:protein-L-isoaspartate(D-aspartate) O-methyltransferase [Peristeroidobacter soli]|uniref:protein-L-isoaspartate(D-aspartate) O-methyltransferase n=1 Tax=Peristeroidobacter soli TaxID=2497877 RepID=UPI001C37B83F|nr:protein-L-isoaspartate(D-aspartate) O-methyltransferase [Peristeroidobacter soli]